MAVEPNVRKRKHSAQNDEGAETVPKKIQKKQKKVTEPKATVDNVEENESVANTSNGHAETPDSGFEEKPMKFSNDFKMLNFRTKLRGTNFITELRHFLHLSERNTRIVAKYIEKRGKPLEIAEALARVDQANVLHLSYVCQALQAVVMEIVSNQPKHMESAGSACRYFLKVHSNVIGQLLESPQIKHRRIALKLLTAIVCVDPQMGRQILAAFNILSDVRKIDQLLSHTKFELHEEETVRKCYIHFVLAFLVDGNTLLVQNILDRGILIQALISGLLYDDSLTVCLVLKTLKKYVLESTNISKTKKIHVFEVESCKHLVRLYDWFGPKVFATKFASKNAATSANGVHLSIEKINTLVDAEERETVASAVHEFLLVLFSSRKHGITFDVTPQLRQKHNTIQGKIIAFVHKPWLSAKKEELILKTLAACPDLARNSVRHFAGVVSSKRTAESEWIQAADFLGEVIRTLHPNLLRNALTKLTLTDFSFWIKDICLPLETLVALQTGNMLNHININCRLATHRLLLVMFTQYSNFMDAAMQREQLKGGGGSSLRRFKFDLFNHILTHFPSVDKILSSLYLTTSIIGKVPNDVVLEHLNVTLDLILIICKQNRAFVNRTGTILDYLKLIRPLYAGEEEEENDDEEEESGVKEHNPFAHHGDIKLEIKAIKTILLLHPNALEPHQELFGNVLKSFIKGFIHGDDDVQQESGELLREIFKNTGIFDAGILEIDLWLEALRYADETTVDVVTQVFTEVLKVTQADVDLPAANETQTNESNLQKLFENIEKGYSVQTYMQEFAMSKLLPLIFKGVEIVKPLDKYIELISVLLYHYHPTPTFVGKVYEMKFTQQQRYMKIWAEAKVEITKSQQLVLPKVTSQIPFLEEIQNSLFETSSKVTFESIFKAAHDETTETFEFEIERRKFVLPKSLRNERLLLIYVQQLLFLITQLASRQQLTATQAKRGAEYIVNFLALLNEIEAQRKSRNVNSNNTYTEDGNIVKKEHLLGSLISYFYDVRLGHITSAELLNTEQNTKNAENDLFLCFLNTITAFCSTLKDFENRVKNFRPKIVKAIAISMEAREATKLQPHLEFLNMVEVFELNSENCAEILNLLCTQLKYSDFFSADLQKNFYYELLVRVLRRLAVLGKAIECADAVKMLSKLYTNFIRKLDAELNVEDFELAFHDFLQAMHQFIPLIESKFFECLFVERKANKASVKLASLLLQRCDKFNEKFINLLPANVGKRELVYPLLEVAFEKSLHIESAVLTNIYQEYRNGFMKTVEKPQKAGVIYKEHATCTVALIAACMPETECIDFSKKRFQMNDASEVFQLRLIHAIYEKALKATEKHAASADYAKIFVNFLNLLIQMLAADLKRQTLPKEKLDLYAYQIFSWFDAANVEGKSKDFDFAPIVESQHFQNFCKSCLKTGMQIPETLAATPEVADALNSQLLKLMAYLCDKLYADHAPNETEESIEPPVPAQLFELICTHSKYYEIVLSSKPCRIKAALLCLLYTLAKKSPSLALPHMQIPVILGAYQAKLAVADRFALALLQLYEEHNPQGLQQYRPFIWGESAVSFYALHVTDLDERSRLTQQETTINLVMSLLERHTCDYTIDNFPIWRKLHTMQQLPELEFSNPANVALAHFGTSTLERYIELNWSIRSRQPSSLPTSIDPRLCPQLDDTFEQCYDPAFFVPLMSSCFSPGSYAHPARPVQNGLLALCFAALSSQDKEMRQAAGVVQLRYRTHFEQSKFYERPLWVQAYDNIQAGLAELSDSWKQKHKKHSKEYMPIPRVPYIAALFIAKTFNITNDPTNVLYKQLTMYLRLKSTFNFQCVPEFNVLFHSPEVEHQTYRQFIVEVIRQGLKCSADLFLLVSTNTFKVLLGFYGGAMSTLDTNLLILSTLATCTRIPAAAKIMIEHVGILPWLEGLINNLEFYHFDIIQGVISVLSNLWYAVTATSTAFYNYNFIALEIHHAILNLVPLLSARIEPTAYASLVNILQKTAQTAKQALPYAAMTEDQLDKLIGCAQKHFGAPAQHLLNLKALGGAGAESHKDYCAELYAQTEMDSNKILALSSLRAYIIDWWQSR